MRHVYEDQIIGEHYKGGFEVGSGSFVVDGLRPKGSFIGIGAELTFGCYKQKLFISLRYDGRLGKHYRNNAVLVSLGTSF